jgi:hypothetical protein
MTIQVVGAGLGRTGTHSLKLALERLLGGPCFHMTELLPRPEQIPSWHGAINGNEPDWAELLDGFMAAVDWPAAAVWPQLSAAFPEAMVLLSVRESAEAWWESFSHTILEVMKRGPGPDMNEWYAMCEDMLNKCFTPDYRDRHGAIAGYEAFNENVRRRVPASKLIEWRPGEGWTPLCEGLGIAVPDEAFPHVNTTDDFRAIAGLT